MNKRKELQKKEKDWYEILNENFKSVNKDLDNLDFKKKSIMKEQVKLNRINLIMPTDIENQNNEENKKEEISFPEENKLILNRLNLKNYKTKNYVTGNVESLFLKDILERIEKLNVKIINRSKYKSNKANISKENTFTFYNKPKNLTSRNNNDKLKELNNIKKEDIKNNNNYLLLSKTFNEFNSRSNDSNTKFPKIKVRNKILNRSKNKGIMKMVLTEEDNTVHKAKSISDKILQLNKNFLKKKNLICGYKDKEEDYIVINNKKIYQINIEKEINKKYLENFINIKKVEDIEQKLLNNNKILFDNTRRNLILRYKQKKQNTNINKNEE